MIGVIALIMKRRTVVCAIMAVMLLLVAVFAWIYLGALRQAVAEFKLEAKGPGETTAVANVNPGAGAAATATRSAGAAAAGVENSLDQRSLAAAVSAQAKQDSKQFFAQFRLERDRVRSQQVDLLREMVNNPATTAESRDEAQKRLLELTRQMEREMELENLMVAKGYPEAAAFIQPDGVTVVLYGAPLSPEQRQAVGGLASRLLGLSEDQVSIICRK